jgi:hypothetical protein
VAAGCQPSAAPSPPTPAPAAAAAAASASPTEPLPTATITSSPAAEPSATFAPEIVATKPEHIAGEWLIKWVGLGSLVRFDAVLTFRPDSTFSLDDKTDGMHIFGGTLQFADGKVTLDSNSCYDEVKAQFFHCTMTFTIYATLQQGKPLHIRFVSAGGTGTFHKNVDDRTLKLAAPQLTPR